MEAELATAKKLDAGRPDAYFNEGILTQEFLALAGSPPKKALEALDRAQASFQHFLEKADGKAEYADAVTQARERLKDIEAAKQFISKT